MSITYGRRIRLARIGAGYNSRMQAAGNTAFCSRTLDDYETDKRTPDIFNVCALYHAFGDRSLLDHYCTDICPVCKLISQMERNMVA